MLAVPALVRPPVPLPMPEKVVLLLSPPAVSVFAPSVTLPAPASEPTVSLAPRLTVAPVPTITALASAIATPPLTLNVPPLTLVTPLYVFLPHTVTLPLPPFLIPPLPLLF